MSERKRIERRFSILVMLYWCSNCSLYGYLWTWLSSRGFTPSEIGLLTAVKTVSSSAGQLIFPAIADRKRNNRTLFAITMCGSLFSFLIACTVSGFWAMAAAMMLVGLFAEPASCLLDSWIMEHMHGDMTAFGKIRSTGSISYGLMVPLYGLLIDKLGYAVMPYAAFILCAATVMFVKTLSKAGFAGVESNDAVQEKGFRLLKNALSPALITVLTVFFLMGVCVMPVYYCSSLAMEAIGGNTALIGLMYFADSATEFFFMRGIIKPLRRLTATSRLSLSLCVYVVSTLFIFFAKKPWAMFLPLALNGAAYGLQLPARRQLVAQLVPEQFRTTVNGAVDMLYGGIGGVIGSALIGHLTDMHGAAMCMLITSGMQVLTVLVFNVALRTQRVQKKKNFYL